MAHRAELFRRDFGAERAMFNGQADDYGRSAGPTPKRHFTPEAAAAVICFEWLQRPENVLAGILRWPDYRSKEWPSAIKILHHKTGAVVWHPLEETVEATTIQFYAEAEAILAQLPRRGVPMVLREVKTRNGVGYKPFSYSGFEKIVQQLRKKIEGVPTYFTLDACRHGGMTELEEAGAD